MSNIITLRNVYKIKESHIQPMKQKNGLPYPFVKPVKYTQYGSEMILSESEMNSPEAKYFIPEDMDIVLTEGKTFDLDNPLEKNIWECIKDSDLIVYDRFERDNHGDLKVDGNKYRYGKAEWVVEIPGVDSERSVNKRKLINRAWSFIGDDSANGMLTKVKLLGRNMMNSPLADVAEYLYQIAEADPEKIINLYTSEDVALKLLIIDAKEKRAINKEKGFWMYGDTLIGATEEAILVFLKHPDNKNVLDMLKDQVYPQYAKRGKVTEPESNTGEKKTTKK